MRKTTGAPWLLAWSGELWDQRSDCDWSWLSQPPTRSTVMYDNVFFLIPPRVLVRHTYTRRAWPPKHQMCTWQVSDALGCGHFTAVCTTFKYFYFILFYSCHTLFLVLQRLTLSAFRWSWFLSLFFLLFISICTKKNSSLGVPLGQPQLKK